MLRTTQQQLVDLSGQADVKASIVMTTSAILTSVAAARLEHESVRWSRDVHGRPACRDALRGLLLAPDLRTKLPAGGARNPLFFGHFGAMPRDEYLAAMAKLMRSDASVYRTIADDLHAAGGYLLLHKFRYLRLSYVLFLGAFALAGMQQLITVLVD